MSDHGHMLSIRATDGFDTGTYSVAPDQPRAGLICVMEAFGVNDHIRRVADDYAAQGYAVLAPQLYDRIQRDADFDYHAERETAVNTMKANGFDNPMHDVTGCVEYFRQQGIQRVGIVGYCYGGAVSWLAASRNPDIAAAACYYGSAILHFLDEHPRCPTIAHWGKTDPTTPQEQVADVAAANPDVTMYWYDAGHGFNSDDREESYDPAAATLARERTLAFFAEQL